VPFSNVYDDDERAQAYARLEFPGTYYLAFRDLPALIAEHVRGRAADPNGRYLLVSDGDYSVFEPRTYDLILSAFAFDNIPGVEHRAEILRRLRRLLHGRRSERASTAT
jgi:hypothetical protein